MGWLDRQGKVLLVIAIGLHVAILAVYYLSDAPDDPNLTDGYPGLVWVLYAAYVIVVFGLLIPLAAFGFAIPLAVFDVLGVITAAIGDATPGAELAWTPILVLFAVSAAVAVYLQMLRLARRQEPLTRS